MIPWTRTKIVATLGPATATPGAIKTLIESGVDVFRLNFAHGTQAEHGALIRTVRSLERGLGAAVGILQDLPGPKIRVGPMPEGGLKIVPGDEIFVGAQESAGGTKFVPLSPSVMVAALKPGHSVFIADGTVRLKVKLVQHKKVLCRAMTAGHIRSGNGVNLPDTPIGLSAFTRADARHMLFGLKAGVDFFGLSFVGGEEDVLRARRFAQRHGFSPFLVAKIERRSALKNLRGIVRAADGLMVARGDLGVEMPFAEIPGLQADIVRNARKEGKPVIVATQVLESMVTNPRPTRAEATDIANAVGSGADAVMLSGETSIGRFPVQAVQALNAVIRATERRWIPAEFESHATLRGDRLFVQKAISLAEAVKARMLIALVGTGHTAALFSSVRTRLPVTALVSERTTQRRLTLFRGVKGLSWPRSTLLAPSVQALRKRLLAERFALRGERVALLLARFPGPSETDLIQIFTV